ncbi:MAG: GTPase HflX [Spirochaetales bacterium]
MKQENNKTLSTQEEQDRAILVFVNFDNRQNFEMDYAELKSLTETMGAEVVGKLIQNRQKPDPAFVIGKGKVEELKALIKELDATLVIFDTALVGSRINNLEEELEVRVIDRSILILDIFAARASSREGKLQVELAQLKYSLPRLTSLQSSEGRFGGGVGMRGPGETKLELSKRVIEKRILDYEKDIEKIKENREINRNKRKTDRKKTVAIVGYTNAGKSTLMNIITKANVLAKDMLFATLDTTTRNVYLEYGKEILLIDTVGFVSKLPHEFIEAFSATLEEAVYADILLHIVDVSNPLYREQAKVVLEVLKNLGIKNTPIITVYNKVDKAPDFVMPDEPNSVSISALKNEGIDELKQKIIALL